MTKQLDELRHWISSLDPRQRLFEHQSNEAEQASLDPTDGEDLRA